MAGPEVQGGTTDALARAGEGTTVRAQRPEVLLMRPGMFVQFTLEGHCDATNMLKGMLDGIQDSGLVANDRHIAPVTVLPTLRHPRGERDEAWLAFWENQG